MATRFYFPDNTAPAITPAFDVMPNPGCGSWSDVTSGSPTRHTLVTTKASTSFTTISVSGTWGLSDAVLVRQYISPALQAQTILTGGNIKAQFRAMENNAAANIGPFIVVRLFSSDGLTLREGSSTGGCLTMDSPGIEFATALRNSSFADAVTNELYEDFVAQAGDVLVVDVGFILGAVGAYTGSIEFGDNSASDLPENETSTDQYCSWIEFSQDLVLQSEPEPVVVTPPSITGGGKMSYKSGDNYIVCDISGRTVYMSESRKTWDGLRVHPDYWDPRHPQLDVKGKIDRQTVVDGRPPQVDHFLTLNEVTAEDL